MRKGGISKGKKVRSQRVHWALGFEVVETSVHFREAL
jgi:hypothetical protein